MAAAGAFIAVSVGVFDFDEFDVLHFGVFPMERDAPWRFAGIRVDRVFGGALELVVVEYGDEAEGFFIGLIENRQPLEGFGGVEAAEFVELSSTQFLSEE